MRVRYSGAFLHQMPCMVRLPRTTEDPVLKRGDSPREIAARGVYKVLPEMIIPRGKCSGLPARAAA